MISILIQKCDSFQPMCNKIMSLLPKKRFWSPKINTPKCRTTILIYWTMTQSKRKIKQETSLSSSLGIAGGLPILRLLLICMGKMREKCSKRSRDSLGQLARMLWFWEARTRRRRPSTWWMRRRRNWRRASSVRQKKFDDLLWYRL